MNLLDIAIAKKMSGGGGSEPVIESLSVTENGTYEAPSGVDGYNPITVNVSGGGGGGSGTLLHTESLGLIQYSSTSAGSLDKSITVSGVTDYDLLIVVISADNKIANQHQATASFILMTTNGSFYSDLDGNRSSRYPLSDRINYIKDSSGNIASRCAQNGVYPYAPTVASDGTIAMPIYARYNGNTTGTINDTYTARVYGVNLYELL